MKKVRSWQTWDWTSIRRTILLFLMISAGLLFVFFYEDWKREKAGEQLTQVSKAKLLRVEQEKEMSQSETGNKLLLRAIKVRYAFEIKGKTIYASDRIPSTLQNNYFIDQILSGSLDSIEVRYHPAAARQSQVIVPVRE